MTATTTTAMIGKSQSMLPSIVPQSHHIMKFLSIEQADNRVGYKFSMTGKKFFVSALVFASPFLTALFEAPLDSKQIR